MKWTHEVPVEPGFYWMAADCGDGEGIPGAPGLCDAGTWRARVVCECGKWGWERVRRWVRSGVQFGGGDRLCIRGRRTGSFSVDQGRGRSISSGGAFG